MRNAYLSALYDIAKDDKRVMALVADNGAIVYDRFRKDFPDRFINFGIAEANMIGVAAGLASCGKIPFAYTISSFLTMRAYEQIRNDVCMQKTNVKLVGIGAGFVYSTLGPTHHNTEDIALMRILPEMIILSPADALEAKKATFEAARIEGPVYLRLSTSNSPLIYQKDYDFKIGKGVILKEGKDVAIIATGTILEEVLLAAQELEKVGISTCVVNIHTIKPIDKDIILKVAHKTQAILTVEEHSIYAGLGSCVAEIILECGKLPIEFKRLGLDGQFACGYGSYQEMKEMNKISKNEIAKAGMLLYERKSKRHSAFSIKNLSMLK